MADVQIVSVAIPDPGGDDIQLFLFRAPTDANGGGITITEAYACDSAADGGAGGTSFTVALHKYSTAGTPALNGTIAAGVGGTAAAADYWAADVPKTFTISAGFIDAGEWVVAQYNEHNTGNPTNLKLNIHYVMGR